MTHNQWCTISHFAIPLRKANIPEFSNIKFGGLGLGFGVWSQIGLDGSVKYQIFWSLERLVAGSDLCTLRILPYLLRNSTQNTEIRIC